MGQPRRRVSYVISPAVEPVQYLQLPPYGVSRLGAIGPLLIPRRTNGDVEPQRNVKHPRHRLGVSSLALDTSTQLAGHTTPEGILYSGGRDGLVLSWDLGITMKGRKLAGTDTIRRRRSGRWETMTGWADHIIDEEVEEHEERLHRDGDILGDVTPSKRRPRRNSMPYENQWETDLASFHSSKVKTVFSFAISISSSQRCSLPNFVNLRKPIQTGLTISCCVTLIRQVYMPARNHFTASDRLQLYLPRLTEPSNRGIHTCKIRWTHRLSVRMGTTCGASPIGR